jgi:hypothetical protein
MMVKVKRKIGLSVLGILLALTFTFSITVIAATGSIDSTTKHYSPNTGKYTYSNNTSTKTIIVQVKDLVFDSTRINKIHNEGIDIGSYKRYPGLDFRDTQASNAALNGVNYQSNYPNPKYDLEDDSWSGDGANEEIEVVSLSPLEMKANFNYYFIGTYKHVKSTGNGAIYASAHKSKAGFSDYNTVEEEKLKYIDYNLVNPDLNAINFTETNKAFAESDNNRSNKKVKEINVDNKGMSIQLKENNGKIKATVLPNEKDLNKYIQYNNDLINNLDGNSEYSVTITFKKPLPKDEVEKMLTKYNILDSSFIGRGIGTQGERVTFAYDDSLYNVEQKEINEFLNYSQTEYKGIFSIKGTLIDGKKIKTLASEEKVFLADIVQNFIYEDLDVSTNIKVDTHSPFWYIENQ